MANKTKNKTKQKERFYTTCSIYYFKQKKQQHFLRFLQCLVHKKRIFLIKEICLVTVVFIYV